MSHVAVQELAEAPPQHQLGPTTGEPWAESLEVLDSEINVDKWVPVVWFVYVSVCFILLGRVNHHLNCQRCRLSLDSISASGLESIKHGDRFFHFL